TNRAAEQRECCTSASTDETVGEQPLATSQIVLSTSCGIDAGQGFILAQQARTYFFTRMMWNSHSSSIRMLIYYMA
ncbi:MAG TPA: hypothetical protein VI894_00675, partial [Candidatus Nanoarchaeia archaeon]|nr:hypothetical protein [Candidatus Nanoarchaeia archaeon]